jgi:CubicO group peptidase (beta-lactamase class C family)
MNAPRGLFVAIALTSALTGFTARSAQLPKSSQAAEGLSEEKLEKVNEIMNGLVRDRHIAGGIVLIARHGKVVFHEPYGRMHLDDDRPVERDTIFRIYSMSKAITSAAALVLVDDGKLDLNAPVSKYLPEFKNLKVLDGEKERDVQHAMTVTDLFCHTSGITYGNQAGSGVEKMFDVLEVLDKPSDLALMTTKLGQMPLSFDPGQDWKYGASIDVLGRVVEVVSGKPLDAFLQERLFAPLGMTDTGFYVPPDKLSRFAANYYSDGRGRLIIRDEPRKSDYGRKPGLLSGGGGLVGTAADYLRFLLMVSGNGQLEGKRILSEKSVKLMTTNQLPERVGWVTFGETVRTGVGFGLGFAVTVEPSNANPHARQDEYGWGGAASTHYWVSPRDELVVVTMEQRMPYSPETEILLKPVIYDAIAK